MTDHEIVSLALRLARRGLGRTSPNPMVGAVVVKRARIIGRGWHHKAGAAHAEVEAIRDAIRKGHDPAGATLYVTLEPCSTRGQTPPCTEAIRAAGIRRVVVGAKDPNPKHAGRGLRILKRAGIEVMTLGASHTRGPDEVRRRHRRKSELQTLADACTRLNESFNHWIVHRTPFVTVKAAMTLDGKIGTAKGESKWITEARARAYGMNLRQATDAILVGINTVLADDPELTIRSQKGHRVRRVVLDSMARTPLNAKVVSDECASLTTIVVGRQAPKKRVTALARRANVLIAPAPHSAIRNRQSAIGNPQSAVRNPQSLIDLRWLLRRLGSENVTSLLVEGGGEVNASFLLGGFTHRVAFFYAPKILGGRKSLRAVGGEGIGRLEDVLQLEDIRWRQLGPDLLLTARVRRQR